MEFALCRSLWSDKAKCPRYAFVDAATNTPTPWRMTYTNTESMTQISPGIISPRYCAHSRNISQSTAGKKDAYFFGATNCILLWKCAKVPTHCPYLELLMHSWGFLHMYIRIYQTCLETDFNKKLLHPFKSSNSQFEVWRNITKDCLVHRSQLHYIHIFAA